MGRVATAFTGAALFVGGLDISPIFAAEKPQASTGASVDPIAPHAGPRKWTVLRFPQSFEAISSADVVEEVEEDGGKSISQLYSENNVSFDSLLGRRGALTWLGNAHQFRRTTRSSSMGYFTTSRRKFRKPFS